MSHRVLIIGAGGVGRVEAPAGRLVGLGSHQLVFEQRLDGIGGRFADHPARRGRIIGIEQSPEMIDKARQRVAAHGWKNVDLVCSPVETAALPAAADADAAPADAARAPSGET